MQQDLYIQKKNYVLPDTDGKNAPDTTATTSKCCLNRLLNDKFKYKFQDRVLCFSVYFNVFLCLKTSLCPIWTELLLHALVSLTSPDNRGRREKKVEKLRTSCIKQPRQYLCHAELLCLL